MGGDGGDGGDGNVTITLKRETAVDLLNALTQGLETSPIDKDGKDGGKG